MVTVNRVNVHNLGVAGDVIIHRRHIPVSELVVVVIVAVAVVVQHFTPQNKNIPELLLNRVIEDQHH